MQHSIILEIHHQQEELNIREEIQIIILLSRQ